MATQCSKNASLKYNSVVIPNVTSWSFDQGFETVDVTGLGDANRVMKECIRNPSCTIEYAADDSNAAHLSLETIAVSAGAVLADGLVLYENTSDYWTFPATAIIESFGVTAAVGDVVKVSMTVRANGAVNKTRG